MTELPPGRAVVSVAGSAANLGPGFDSLGLALELRDTVEACVRPADRAAAPVTDCVVRGEGAGQVPTGGSHLVARSLRLGLRDLAPDAGPVDVRLVCDNRVPHGRGLGSSATAAAAGLLLAWTLVHGASATVERRDWLVDRVSAAEGHGDNASASVLGGAVVAWFEAERYRAETLAVDPGIEVVTCVPRDVLPTDLARSLLPSRVPHADAAFTGGRTVLLVEALRGRRDLLLAGTEDRLHQEQRAAAMPRSHELLGRLRGAGIAATISGAGPALLCLGSPAAAVAALASREWRVEAQRVGGPVAVLEHDPAA